MVKKIIKAKMPVITAIIIGMVFAICYGLLYQNSKDIIMPSNDQDNIEVIYGESEDGLTTDIVIDCMTVLVNRSVCRFDSEVLEKYFSDNMIEGILEYQDTLGFIGEETDMLTPTLSNCHIIDNNTAVIDYFETDIFAYRYTLNFNDDHKLSSYDFENIVIQ